MAKLSIRIDFEPSGAVMGPGMAELLERVGKMGSIRKAAASMDMSYRKAWLLIQSLQETFGGDVVHTATGGASGGGATITEIGRKLLDTYHHIQARAAKAVAADLAALSGLVNSTGAQQYPRHKAGKKPKAKAKAN